MITSLDFNQTHITALNERWNNQFFPQIQPNISSESMDPPYEFGEMVGKIHQILCEGKKACLFVGRTSSEILPSNTQEEEWISANMHRVNPGETSLPGRIHLWIDCNQQEAIQCLEKLFDRVVVDWSTIKFLDHDFAKRFSFMLRSLESTLIFEPSTGMQWSNASTLERTFSAQSYNVSYPLRDLQKVGIKSLHSQCNEWGIEQLKLHLETRFEHVELHRKAPFPYPTKWNGIGYFLVSQPKA